MPSLFRAREDEGAAIVPSGDDGVLRGPGQGDERERGEANAVDCGAAGVDDIDGAVMTWDKEPRGQTML